MTIQLKIDNDNDLFIPRFAWANNGEAITDAVLEVTVGSQADGYCGTITGTSGTTSIHIVTAVDTGKLSNGDYVIICQVVGTKAANGVFAVSSVTASGFTLSGVALDAAWISGGVWYKAIPGATNITLAHQGAGLYLGVVDEIVNFEKDVTYMAVVDSTNYGFHSEVTTAVGYRNT